MPQLTSADLMETLQTCFDLARNPKTQTDASEIFAEVQQQLTDHDAVTQELVNRLWKEVVTARRSAAFWEQISDVERTMTEQLAANHVQLQQNYLRLMQEQ
ncbi:hypothetical protein ACQ4M4_03935 [Leptolyngbya sp. AN02str]|uniref:hypothetical protein n=1 Tax=Leptolyngbya sp. AN02str TaxID=3423363 RepID=UPI003D317D08